jgi:hypothetical protein
VLPSGELPPAIRCGSQHLAAWRRRWTTRRATPAATAALAPKLAIAAAPAAAIAPISNGPPQHAIGRSSTQPSALASLGGAAADGPEEEENSAAVGGVGRAAPSREPGARPLWGVPRDTPPTGWLLPVTAASVSLTRPSPHCLLRHNRLLLQDCRRLALALSSRAAVSSCPTHSPGAGDLWRCRWPRLAEGQGWPTAKGCRSRGPTVLTGAGERPVEKGRELSCLITTRQLPEQRTMSWCEAGSVGPQTPPGLREGDRGARTWAPPGSSELLPAPLTGGLAGLRVRGLGPSCSQSRWSTRVQAATEAALSAASSTPSLTSSSTLGSRTP